jgi:hypothetical protein
VATGETVKQSNYVLGLSLENAANTATGRTSPAGCYFLRSESLSPCSGTDSDSFAFTYACGPSRIKRGFCSLCGYGLAFNRCCGGSSSGGFGLCSCASTCCNASRSTTGGLCYRSPGPTVYSCIFGFSFGSSFCCLGIDACVCILGLNSRSISGPLFFLYRLLLNKLTSSRLCLSLPVNKINVAIKIFSLGP